MNLITLITTTIFCILMVDLNKFYIDLDSKDPDREHVTEVTIIELFTTFGVWITLVVMICLGTQKEVFFSTYKLLWLMILGSASTIKCVTRMSYYVKL